MKTKILLAVIATMTVAFNAMASDGSGTYKRDYGYGNQQVVVNNYYFDNGYEYASRIKRFHSSYTAFDFYSPMFTETFWYHFTPYTWGVSIYDDWYYYGAGISRYSWRSGFGGSYWWGYDPWWDYDPWMGYGWNSWYNPGISFSINIYLGRPQYHYPVAWNRWNHHQHWNNYRPVYIVNNNNYYYNSYNRNTYNNNREYNPSHPYDVSRRSGYTITNGRSTGSNYTRPDANTGRTQGSDNNSNNGLRMGQYRRGVAEPTDPKPNEPNRPNNPNVNDRTDPGKEKAGTTTRTSVNRTPVQTQPRQQTQNTVRSNTQSRETTMRQNTKRSTSQPSQSTVQKSTQRSTKESTKSKSKSDNNRRSASSKGRGL